MSASNPLILISNDDGITALGIRTLVEIMQELGEVVVVAPNSPQSGMGHAITIGEPLRLYPSKIFDNVAAYECSGTPADCVKLAKHWVLKDRTPDLVVSGINHGSNASVNVLYSGTMSAAIEGAIEGLPSIGFSLCDFSPTAHFAHARPFIKQIAQAILQKGIPKGIALNVNIPAYSANAIAGIKICQQANAKWQEDFEERQDPYGRHYYWMTGSFVNFEKENQATDEWALAHNYVSVVPCQYNLTAVETVQTLKQWNL